LERNDCVICSYLYFPIPIREKKKVYLLILQETFRKENLAKTDSFLPPINYQSKKKLL